MPRSAPRAIVAIRAATPILAILSIGACHRAPPPDEAEGPRVVTVACKAVMAQATRDEVIVRGTLAPLPDRDAKVAAQVAGALRSVEVREGDEVAVGQVIAHIDDGALADAERQAQAALLGATAERKNAQTSLARSEQVYKAGIAARQEVDDAAARVATTRAAEDAARAALSVAHRDRERAVVTSPIAGVVLHLLQKPGELVDGTVATPIVEIADTSRLELVADVAAQDLAHLVRGQSARVLFAGSDAPIAATVAAVAPAVDRATGFGTLRLALPPLDAADKAAPRPPIGSYATAMIAVGAERQGLFVPAAAVRAPLSGAGEVVVCGADKHAHVRSVKLGGARDGLVEVVGELTGGDRVVVDPVLGVADGDGLEEGAPADKGGDQDDDKKDDEKAPAP